MKRNQPKLKQPFNELERQAWEALGEAYKYFMLLKPTHPQQHMDFCNGIHACQNILSQRVLQRDYPGTYASYKEDDGQWVLDDRSIQHNEV